jgi:hypothetical protein
VPEVAIGDRMPFLHWFDWNRPAKFAENSLGHAGRLLSLSPTIEKEIIATSCEGRTPITCDNGR